MAKYIFLLLFSLGLNSAFSQGSLKYYEFGFGAGTLNAQTDISSTNNTSAILSEMRPQFFAFAQYHFNDWFSMGVNAGYGWLYMDDANHGQSQRGFYNRTELVQVNPYLLMHFVRFGKYHYKRKFTAYVKAGAGFIGYDVDPQARRQIDEETTFNVNSGFGGNVFGGFGIKFRTSRNSTLALETTWHNTLRDDFDGLESGLDNDRYSAITLSYGVLIL